MKPVATMISAFAVLAGMLPASAQTRMEAGILDCIIEGGLNIAIATSKEFSCAFQPADHTRTPETYSGIVNRFGLEVGATGERVMRWAVLAPTATDPYAPGALAGNYVGASAEVTAGIGGGANILVSEDNRNLMLQPISLQAQTGLNLALGVTGFQLRSTAP
ncbi:DUF992 domain-containing protein [Chelativorans sp. Marseille-P2723]|uniref:DUF992 domain-containing protein n=1 Tax=Chelativorans sp. Marseille-P2723 TaxID=2709133 RepID=UPI0015712D8B|nr:DUF992 domain-containing protein [Chelativorans sp. Marseille-P2723]